MILTVGSLISLNSISIDSSKQLLSMHILQTATTATSNSYDEYLSDSLEEKIK